MEGYSFQISKYKGCLQCSGLLHQSVFFQDFDDLGRGKIGELDDGIYGMPFIVTSDNSLFFFILRANSFALF